MTYISFPSAPGAIRHAIETGKLKAGDWGDGTNAVCMMSAIVSGARSTDACVTSGWPKWLVDLNVYLFDANVGAEDEAKASSQFALDVAMAVSKPFDADKARDLFLIKRLDTGDHSALKSLRMNMVDADWWRDCEAAVLRVVDLLNRRLAGEDVDEEMERAANAARVAASSAIYGSVHATASHATAADAAHAAAAAYSTVATAAYASDAADDAAGAAARADLIEAITASHNHSSKACIAEAKSTVTGE